MRYPEFLKEHGTIGFVAPSFGCAIEPYHTCFDSALQKFHDRGFATEPGPNCYEGSGIGISNTPQKCAEELMEYYEKKSNDILISCGGGELMCTVLPYMDFERVRKADPKWYMGYSDNTNFTFLLTTLCDVAALYGPCAASFGMEPYHESLEDALAILQGKKQEVHSYPLWEKEKNKDEEHPLLPYHCTEPSALRGYDIPERKGTDFSDHIEPGIKNIISPEKISDENLVQKNAAIGKYEETDQIRMKGRLLGGCMDCLQLLVGTPYDKVREFNETYGKDGIIWFLESCDLNVFDIRRAMWQMDQAGWFSNTAGFLIGRPLCFGEEMMGMDQYRAVLSTAEKYKVPVIMDADLGHLPPAMPIVNGALAEITYEEKQLSIRYEYK